MAGPHPPNPTVGADGPAPYAEGGPHQPPPVEFPHEPTATEPPFPAAYPGPYHHGHPRRRTQNHGAGGLIIGILRGCRAGSRD